MTVSRVQFLQSFETARLVYETLELQGGARLIVTKRGGRAFLFQGNTPTYWIPEWWKNPAKVKDFLASQDWNMGGERLYIGPEIQYSVRDRTRVAETFFLPAANDPGSYQIERSSGAVCLSQSVELTAYNLGHGPKNLHLERSFTPLPDPLRYVRAVSSLRNRITYAGYAQAVVLRETTCDGISSESWLITQLSADGDVIVPATDKAEATVFYGSPSSAAMTQNQGCFRFPVTGNERFKVGYKSPFLSGKVAYATVDTLLIRAFFNNPSTEYLEEPPHRPGERGHSVFIYNDGGELGGFGEIECSGHAVGPLAVHYARDMFCTWVFKGHKSDLEIVAQILLGISV